MNKKIILAFVLSIVFLSFVFAESYTFFRDSDNGLNYFEKGYVYSYNETDGKVILAIDACNLDIGRDMLIERINETAGYETISFNCSEYSPASYCQYGECITGNHWCSRADINMNGRVDISDLALLSGKYRKTNCIETRWCNNADINMDGRVDISDLTILLSNYRKLNCTD